MDKLFDNAKKELKQIEQTGLNSSNIDNAYKLLSIAKNIKKLEMLKEGEGNMRGGYMDYDRDYDRRYDGYRDDERYGRRGIPGSGRGGRYRGDDNDRMYDHLDRIMEGVEMYKYGRGRYRDSGDQERMHDGLEKLMYAICMFIESTMDFAESPEEKEIIRKHIQKIKNL